MMSSASTQRTGRASKDRGPKTQPSQAPSKVPDGTKGSPSEGSSSKAKCPQPTPEQLRIAQITSATKLDDAEVKSKIDEITRVTGKTSDQAIVALHDCDNDTNRAVNLLMDGIEDEGKWETSCKKKKNRQAAQKVTEINGHDNVSNEKEEKEPIENTSRKRESKPREGGYRYRGPPRMNRGGNTGRSWRNKENEKNERNLQDGRRERNSEGRSRGPRRGRGRGGRSRTFQNRGLQNDGFPESIDTWTNSTAEKADISNTGDTTMTVGNWSDIAIPEEWSEEDWTENLTETKVFTPSASTQSAVTSVDINSSSTIGQNLDLATLLQKAKSNSESPSNSLSTNGITQPPSQNSLMSQQIVNQMSQPVAAPPPSHFDFNQFAKQAAETIKAAVGVVSVPNAQSTPSMNANSFQSNSGAYQSNYGVNNSNSQHHVQMAHELQQAMVSQAGYSSSSSGVPQPGVHVSPDLHSAVVSQQPASASSTKPATTSQHQPLPQRVKSHKARLPPPSKIPESAVVMPDDPAVSSLDVQFGALQFGADSSPFDFTTTESNTAYQDMSSNSNSSSHVANQSMSCSVSSHTLSNSMPSSASMTKESTYGIASHNSVNQNTITKELAQSQKVAGQESLLLSQVDHKNVDTVSSYVNHRSNQSTNLDGSIMGSKSDQPSAMSNYNSSSHDNSSSYSSVQYGNQKSGVLNTSSLVPSTASYSHSSSLSTGASDLSSTQQQQPQQQQQQQSQKYQSQVSQSQNTSYVTGSNSYGMQPSAYSASTSTTGNTYPSQTGYNSGMTYGSSGSNYSSQQGYSGSVTASTQAGTILSTSVSNSKLTNSLSHSVKESSLLDSQHNSAQSSYDVSTTTASSVLSSSSLTSTSTANHNAQSSTNMNSVLGLGSGTVSTSSSALKNSVSSGKTNIPNIPQNVQMVGHQYVMQQAGLPFYGLQQPMYSYEDMQLMQSKLSMSYYDMQFPTPTSITGRDPGMGSVAYTAADGKYSRADSDASAVATTLSQGQANTQAHSQAIFNPAAAALPPGYGYYFPGSVLPGGIHHYAPPIFPVPPATNTHGATTNTQFQKAAAYGSHSYGSGYESLTQTQDFSKGTYGAASQNQVKGVSAGSGVVPDLSGSVYSKTHTQLAKSYDKPGFHTGTPPPFNLAGNQAAGTLGASSGPYPPQFIPVLASQHHQTMLHHHHIAQDTAQTGGSPATGQRGPQGLGQQKNSSKQNYVYWPNNN